MLDFWTCVVGRKVEQNELQQWWMTDIGILPCSIAMCLAFQHSSPDKGQVANLICLFEIDTSKAIVDPVMENT